MQTKRSFLWIRQKPNWRFVVIILLSNAFLKYTKKGGEIAVKIEVNGKDLIITVTIQASGCQTGIANAFLTILSSCQNSETSNLVGSGIGLAFSKKIVELASRFRSVCKVYEGRRTSVFVFCYQLIS